MLSKLAILKQDIWNELKVATFCRNDKNIYLPSKKIKVQHMELMQGRGKHKTPLQGLHERAEFYMRSAKNTLAAVYYTRT